MNYWYLSRKGTYPKISCDCKADRVVWSVLSDKGFLVIEMARKATYEEIVEHELIHIGIFHYSNQVVNEIFRQLDRGVIPMIRDDLQAKTIAD